MKSAPPAPASLCIDGATVPSVTGVLPGASATALLPEGVHNPDLSVAGQPCSVPNPVSFVAGTKFALTARTASTYPTAAAVTAAVDAVQAVIASGDADVPATIMPQWEILTAGLRELTTGLQLVGGDVSLLPAASLQAIVDGVNSTAPDPDTEAATTVLTNWYISNCIAAPTPEPATPKYTG